MVSTLPLPATCRHDLAVSAVERRGTCGKRLRYRSLKLIYIALKRPQLTDYHWVYLLELSSA